MAARPENMRNDLMVAAAIIAFTTFQVGFKPPEESLSRIINNPRESGPLLVYLNKYSGFYLVNTIAFAASLSLILLLVSGLPVKQEAVILIFMVITCVAVLAFAFTYIAALATFAEVAFFSSQV